MPNLTGKLLIATPNLIDPNFKQAVVLMVQVNEEGAVGLILNRLSDKRVIDLWNVIFQGVELEDTTQMIHLGGPVFGPLMLLHTRKELADLEILPGLYFATQKEYLEEVVNNNIQPFRLFLGHSGWGPGQLQREIDEGSWFIIPAAPGFAFDKENDIWQIGLRIAGRDALARLLGRNDLPDDPMMN